MTHILTRLIERAERAAGVAQGKPPFLPDGYLDSSDIHALKVARAIYFCAKIEGLRRMAAADTISAHFKTVHLDDRFQRLREEVGPRPAGQQIEMAQVLDPKVNVLALVEGWFREPELEPA